ncbi:hypothetical protein AMECASPLE_033429 [Ameca splendens]|uniref:YqaJ viral recombinase domain-containing protein n=1 Tax=Ameca splendens TaxID=208324 RepID=A0ABV0ZRS3_9TELE
MIPNLVLGILSDTILNFFILAIALSTCTLCFAMHFVSRTSRDGICLLDLENGGRFNCSPTACISSSIKKPSSAIIMADNQSYQFLLMSISTSCCFPQCSAPPQALFPADLQGVGVALDSVKEKLHNDIPLSHFLQLPLISQIGPGAAPVSQPDDFPNFPLPCQPTSFCTVLNESAMQHYTELSISLTDSLERETREQSTNNLWFNARSPRITSTSFNRICSRRNNHVKLATSLKSAASVQTKAMKRGVEQEPIAAIHYTRLTGMSWCDFFVKCEEDYHLERIHFDDAKWEPMKTKLDVFFFDYYGTCQ